MRQRYFRRRLKSEATALLQSERKSCPKTTYLNYVDVDYYRQLSYIQRYFGDIREDKNGKEPREETEGKSGKVHRES